jgi:secreted PhoX family phosphatase
MGYVQLGAELPPDHPDGHRPVWPARGHAQLVTKYSPDGTMTRGTLNNCGTGKTPWGTFLTGEENWAATSPAARPTMPRAATTRA